MKEPARSLGSGKQEVRTMTTPKMETRQWMVTHEWMVKPMRSANISLARDTRFLKATAVK